MPNSEADRDHKRRQRHRQQERRRQALEALLGRIPTFTTGSTSSDHDSSWIADLYQPIPALSLPVDDEETAGAGSGFWNVVPSMCNPMGTIMDTSIMTMLDSRKVARDQRFQQKLQHKLQSRQDRGEITKEEQEQLWNQHGKVHSHLLSASRGQRKAWQVENFVVLLQQYIQDVVAAAAEVDRPGGGGKDDDDDDDGGDITVVDFGSGTGNLCLALAAYFPQIQFVLVDKNAHSLQLVQQRAESANITNIQVQQFHFSSTNLNDYQAPGNAAKIKENGGRSFDLGIGLHCCGSFTDMVMELCRIHGADCIVCPCCNGGLMTSFHYPRSLFLQQYMTEEEYRSQLSKSADDLHHYSAKCWIEYDRALWAQEHGMKVELWKLTPIECTPKHHVLYLKH